MSVAHPRTQPARAPLYCTRTAILAHPVPRPREKRRREGKDGGGEGLRGRRREKGTQKQFRLRACEILTTRPGQRRSLMKEIRYVASSPQRRCSQARATGTKTRALQTAEEGERRKGEWGGRSERGGGRGERDGGPRLDHRTGNSAQRAPAALHAGRPGKREGGGGRDATDDAANDDRKEGGRGGKARMESNEKVQPARQSRSPERYPTEGGGANRARPPRPGGLREEEEEEEEEEKEEGGQKRLNCPAVAPKQQKKWRARALPHENSRAFCRKAPSGVHAPACRFQQCVR
ncbi:unnamed protein product [Prorocentrum cordatum]|uniref:Uncharacterized protein n=1 Tax=Prorocentrum cordatum TaxID=2364126 RepID=A0ABN9X1C4_9DINO|nr:unnamed protein product [Polarella glacialis]